jgi:plasmid stabilization system protein ParE
VAVCKGQDNIIANVEPVIGTPPQEVRQPSLNGMTRRFIVRPLAEADLEDAARWYEDKRAGLAERFVSDVDRTFARIREWPLQFPTVSGDIRRALLHTFPYAVYFRASDEMVVVLAVLYLRRNPKGMASTSALATGSVAETAGYIDCRRLKASEA